VHRPLDVGVIGCGTAGAAASLFLARAGHAVTLYERVAEPGPVGAGIVLQPTGQSALAALGLLEPIATKGARLTGLVCVTGAGRTIVDLAYSREDPEMFGLGLHRGVLFATLYDAVLREPGIDLRLGVSVGALKPAPSDRSLVVSEGGAALGVHDLVVVADGARSHLGDGVRLRRTSTSYPWGALWFVARDPEGRFSGRLEQTVVGNRRMLGLLPTGLGPDDADPVPHVSLYWSLRCDAVDAWRADGLGPWKDEILALRPDARSVLDQIDDPSQVTMAVYHDVVMPRWHTHNIVVLGDAAHAMSPQLGQGCNLALIDAWTLAACVAAAPSVMDALSAYSASRADHLDFYQFATRWLTPLFQSDHAWLGPLRDVGMGAMSKLAFFEREMVRAMAGSKLGVFGALRDPVTGRRLSPPDRG
jgi:2-polyprenyl-6-methoxyphenol hydroxylase-like FAD-dependent oxidoreductase